VQCLNPGELYNGPYIESGLVPGKPLRVKIQARIFRGCGFLWQHFIVFLPTVTRLFGVTPGCELSSIRIDLVSLALDSSMITEPLKVPITYDGQQRWEVTTWAWF